MRCLKVLIAVTLLLLTAVSATPAQAQTQTIPSTKAKSIDDSEVAFPRPADQQILILILGFSKKSGDVCQVWAKHIRTEMVEDPRVNYYQIASLEAVPSLAKRIILHGIRSGLSPEQQSHFIPLYDNEDQWKKLVNFSAPDDPYLIVASPEGQIAWQFHGPFTDSSYAELKKAASALLKKM